MDEFVARLDALDDMRIIESDGDLASHRMERRALRSGSD
jgi:hypothetical protein